jgi:hypothetical protein
MKTIGYYYDDCVVCVPCHKHSVDKVDDAQPATFIGLPDGFTCVECADVITDKGDK